MSQPQSNTIFLEDATTKFSSCDAACDTHVFWDIDDASIFDDPFNIEKLKDPLVKEGYYKYLSLLGFVDGNILSPELENKWVTLLVRSGLYVSLGPKAEGAKGLDLMFVDILWFALNSRLRRPWNMLVISNNIREDSTYARILEDSKSEKLNVGLANARSPDWTLCWE